MELDITLEKIDLIRERTGSTYKEARDALTTSNGNVIDAIINLEESGKKKWCVTMSDKKEIITTKCKTLLKAGNTNRIRVKKDNNIVIDLPVTAAAISALILPKITAFGTAAAIVSKCTLEVDRQNKGVVNVSNIINTTADCIISKVKDIADDIKCNPGENTQNN